LTVNEVAGSWRLLEPSAGSEQPEIPYARSRSLIRALAFRLKLATILVHDAEVMRSTATEADGFADLYRKPDAWTHKAILDVAASGWFSRDRTVAEYATGIWHARPCPVA
jgi:glucan phosphorylase